MYHFFFYSDKPIPQIRSWWLAVVILHDWKHESFSCCPIHRPHGRQIWERYLINFTLWFKMRTSTLSTKVHSSNSYASQSVVIQCNRNNSTPASTNLSTNYTTALQLRLQSCDLIGWAIGSIQKYTQAQKRKSQISALFLVFVIDNFIDFHFSHYSIDYWYQE